MTKLNWKPLLFQFCMKDQVQCKFLVSQSEKKKKKKINSKKGTTLPPRLGWKCTSNALYITMALLLWAADPHLPDSPLPSFSPPPPDAPEVIMLPSPATPQSMNRHLWSAQWTAVPVLQMPIRETQGLQHFAPDRTLQESETVFSYKPFYTINLLN